MFDRLMLLARGKIIYFNEAKLAVDYFSGIGQVCPELSNPADFFMTMMSIESIQMEAVQESGSVFVDNGRIEQEYQKLIESFDKHYRESHLYTDCKQIAPGI